MLRGHLFLANNHLLKAQQQFLLLLEIHAILYNLEEVEGFYKNIEILDVNSKKTVSKPHLVKRIIKEHSNKPFVFIYHKN